MMDRWCWSEGAREWQKQGGSWTSLEVTQSQRWSKFSVLNITDILDHFAHNWLFSGGVWASGPGGVWGADQRSHDAAEAGGCRLWAVLISVRRDQRRGVFLCVCIKSQRNTFEVMSSWYLVQWWVIIYPVVPLSVSRWTFLWAPSDSRSWWVSLWITPVLEDQVLSSTSGTCSFNPYNKL